MSTDSATRMWVIDWAPDGATWRWITSFHYIMSINGREIAISKSQYETICSCGFIRMFFVQKSKTNVFANDIKFSTNKRLH